MKSLLAGALALLAAPGAEPPEAVVTRFLSLAQRQDWAAAAAMLTPTAQFGIHDVGGPLNAETLPALANFQKAACAMRDLTETDVRMPEHPETRSVDTIWDCPNRVGAAPHKMKITFFVQGEKLAGYYMD